MRHHNLTSLSIILGIMIFTGCAGENPILTRLRVAATEGTPLYGHQDDLMYGHTWNAGKDADTSLTRSDVLDVTGQYPSILGLDLGGIELGHKCNLDGNDFELQRLAAIKHYQRGGIVTLSWHLRNPLTGGDAWDVSSDKVVESVLPGGSKHEMFLGWLDKAADWIESLRTQDGKPIPVLWRPLHEHTGSWFWWGTGLCTAEEYNSLWKMTYNYLTEKRGLRQLAWAISPGASARGFEKWTDRYPGDDYVDVIGLDCYAVGDKQQYISDMRACLESLTGLCKSHKKILAVTETGYEGLPDPFWWTESLSPAISGFPVSYILTWRNSDEKPNHYYAPFIGEPSSEDFKTWLKKDKITLLNL